MDDLQANVVYWVRNLIFGRVGVIDSFCPQPDQSPFPDALACAAGYLDVHNRFLKLVLKCQEKCENDYSGKKGNGGRTNAPVCGGSPHPTYLDCVSKAIDTATKGTTSPDYPSFLAGVAQQVQDICYGFYDYPCQ